MPLEELPNGSVTASASWNGPYFCSVTVSKHRGLPASFAPFIRDFLRLHIAAILNSQSPWTWRRSLRYNFWNLKWWSWIWLNCLFCASLLANVFLRFKTWKLSNISNWYCNPIPLSRIYIHLISEHKGKEKGRRQQ